MIQKNMKMILDYLNHFLNVAMREYLNLDDDWKRQPLNGYLGLPATKSTFEMVDSAANTFEKTITNNSYWPKTSDYALSKDTLVVIYNSEYNSEIKPGWMCKPTEINVDGDIATIHFERIKRVKVGGSRLVSVDYAPRLIASLVD